MRSALYVNVSAKTVRDVIAKHAGMARRSGHLPRMIEVGEDGVMWAEAAEPPSSSDTGGSEADEESEGRRSPYSAVHMGAPPPQPPPTPVPDTAAAAVTGALTPPPQLTQVMLSPIGTTHEEFNLND